MPVIAVVNRKGGSGKSTVAAHLAAWCALNGKAVMLGDVDRQQSTRAWLRRRSPALPAIAPWAVHQSNVLRVPTGITHVVLDTPGGFQGFDLARTVMFSDAILMPVCNSAFDRESAAACYAELMTLPRVASGRCRVSALGMRIDSRTNADQTLISWAQSIQLPFLGVLRETQLYVQSLERGMTIFDLSRQKAATDLDQWEPILKWLEPELAPRSLTDSDKTSIKEASSQIGSSRPQNLMPAQTSMVHGSRLSVVSRQDQEPRVLPSRIAPTKSSRQVTPGEHQQAPSFLKAVK
jgi:chromosome partitioning protein